MPGDLRERVAAAIDGTSGASGHAIADDVLAVEVEPGVTIGDAVRAYLALGRIIGEHESGPWRMHDPVIGRNLGGNVAVWHREQQCQEECPLVPVVSAPTLAAAILAAAEVPDAG